MNTNIDAMVAVAREVAPYVIQVRRELHQCPETRYETEATRRLILQGIREASDKARNLVPNITFCPPTNCQGGIVINIDVAGATDWIAFRADFDALPVTEATGLPFASKHAGKMHACGHDIHAAMLLGFLKCVAEGKVVPKHNLRLVFQDAEENPGLPPEPISGGEMLAKDNVLDGVQEIYGLHVWCNPKRGTPGVFFSRSGGLMGNSGRIKFVLKSSGGHVMEPSGGVNALRVVSAVMNRLDTFIARHLDPTNQPATLEPTIVESGKASNVMPGNATVWYGFRTAEPREKHLALMDEIEAEVKAVAVSLGAELTECQKMGGHPALINDAKAYEKVASLLQGAGQKFEVHPPVLGGEDFAHYLYQKPGCFTFLGAHTPGSGDHHSSTFNPGETVFWQGVLYWTLLATN
jgi:amidohydrolase